METDELVRFSRAGDAFHYRWAARRCLRMISPSSRIVMIIIEGSISRKLAGEDVIDVAEYYEKQNEVTYYQLKHTTKRLDQPITLSDVKGTIQGFADRFKAYQKDLLGEIRAFELITNRPVCQNFKDNRQGIVRGKVVDKRFLTTLKSYTGLSGKRLLKFCSLLVLNDGEGNYLDQRFTLQGELSELVAGVVDNPKIDTLIEMVAEKALPDNQGEITRETVLQRLGVPSIQAMFPAPPEFEEFDSPIRRRQQDELLELIVEAETPIIIHAEGGVGKSVICRQLANSLPNDWKYIIYDCFGAGKYRSRSQPRHRYRDIVAQVSNELAKDGLCEPLIPGDSDLEDALLRSLKSRIIKSIESIRKKDSSANLVIFIDAADNAEMAANEFSESCFANHFINEDFPEGCKVVALCRTERVTLLNPKSTVLQKLLEPFDKNETLSHAQKYYSEIGEDDAKELHRLTTGNPRVQANALSIQGRDLTSLLESLGPSPTTVADQINDQLQNAIAKLKDSVPLDQQHDIDSICYGMANLPPLIPLEVLALAANVHESLIKSFIADLGRPLWLSDRSVMFRDEPTETWFVNQFSTSAERIQSYIEKIKPLANEIPYIAEALPALLLKAGSYSELIELSLSDHYLPENPIDARNVKLYRLQFAFKAALKKQRLADASKLAMLAGEEVSSDNRQFDLLRKNVDLLEKFQSEQRAQDLAYKQQLAGNWQGSENIYSASLLSTIVDCKGESRAYFRAANNWLRIYFEQRNADEDRQDIGRLEDSEIAELVSTHHKLFGAKKVSEFIFQWKPSLAILSITPMFFSRLVDAQEYDEIDRIVSNAKRDDIIRYQYLCLAATHELWRVNRTLRLSTLRTCLALFLEGERIDKKNSLGDGVPLLGAICFAEACGHRKISKVKIRKFLRIHVLQEPPYSVHSEYNANTRSNYLRSIVLDNVLSKNASLIVDDLVPLSLRDDVDSSSNGAERFKQIVGGLLPWYEVRARVMTGAEIDIGDAYENASKKSSAATAQRYSKYDTLPFEISSVQFDIFSFHNVEKTQNKLLGILNSEANKFKLSDRIEALRLTTRTDGLACVSDTLEANCYDAIAGYIDGSPEEVSNDLADIARAVLPKSLPDAQAYFDLALGSVSKFGDEITERWDATAAIAERYSEADSSNKEIAYRFIRCAELVGEYVDSEEYIDRSSALNICASISPAIAVSALSRWHDRDVGHFEEQLVSLLTLLIKSAEISAQTAWSIEALSANLSSIDLIICCIESANEQHDKQSILDESVRELLLEERNSKEINNLSDLREKYRLDSDLLSEAVSYSENAESSRIKSNEHVRPNKTKVDSDQNYERFFEGLNLASIEGINTALVCFDAIDGARSPKEFWRKYFENLGAGNVSIFLSSLVLADEADHYDIECALENVPIVWRNKVSVKKVMPSVVTALVRRFADNYANQYAIKSLEKILDDVSLTQNIHSGMLKGLSEASDFFGAQTLFSFAKIAAKYISTSEAKEALDIALSRFELHMDDDFGDGRWATWLNTDDLSISLSGVVWSALGSPISSTRWSAAHSARRLVEMNCSAEVDALINFMSAGTVEPYGCKSHTFYEFHAKQYLLIALARASVENGECLKKHHAVFIDLALNFSHALIQHFASIIALNLLSHYPDIYDQEDIRSLEQVNKSPFAPNSVENTYRTPLVSPWHESGEADTSIDLYLSYDFDRYWYDPLGRVFGIPSSQVQDLAKEFINGEFGGYTGRYLDDTRKKLFEHNSRYKNTSHSHGSYPDIDSYSFYVSYHAMFIVAAKLLQGMPLIHSRYDDEEEDGWFYWLSRHALTSLDGKWLADRRDIPPLDKRAWLSGQQSEHWRWEISDDDFLNGLIRFSNNHIWLNLDGNWNECNSTMNESYRIASAFVNKETSTSLLNALTTCSDPHDFKLPSYMEDGVEIESEDFKLNGWINDYDRDKRLDRFDYYAGDFYFPPLSIGQQIADTLEIKSDSDGRYWFEGNNDTAPVISSLCWGANSISETEKYVKRGQSVSVDFEFIKSALRKLEKDLIIEVQINRSVDDYRTNRDEDEIKYAPAYSKIYILKEDGELRDATKSYQIGEENC